ncbi:presequence protease, mitochondrial [Brevipalpus obovatus]|uniref:presequence protease, mitochondrial n=1 Tax=Brevipalpus obovatus TaxID=246614 RepID=UPI003D9EAD2A
MFRLKTVSLARSIGTSIRRHTTAAPKPSSSRAISDYEIGQNIHGYILKRVEDIPELLAKAYFLVHQKTQAQHLHVWKEDTNNLVSVAFRTTPDNDTGVPHVLEHLVTMGSENFQCREIFMKMLSRSLATFMNAFTGPDYTCYPFSSTNEKDIENLSRVYLDFAFNPTLKEIDFKQEAWRLENENINDEKSPLKLTGVVLNEMKGVYSNTQSLYFRSILKSLFPDNVYRYDFGGDPLCIPKLTHDGMKQFYAKYYHPSNSRFFTYGNIPFEKHLNLINSLILSKYEHDPSVVKLSEVQTHNRWTSPVTKAIECRPDPLSPFPDKQTTAAVCFMLTNITDTYESFVLSFISSLLTSGQNAEFYTSLIESDIGMDFSPGTGFWDFIKQSVFTVGLQGIHEKDVSKVQNIILDTLKKVADEGFPQERIDALLHSIELALRHQSSNFGLQLLHILQAPWNHGGDPIELLQINERLDRFQSDLKSDPKFLQKKVKQYFLENTHNLCLIMKASDGYVERKSREEKELLMEKTKDLTVSDREQIFKLGQVLREYVDRESDTSCLPCIDVDTDISRKMSKTNLVHHELGKISVQVSPQPTNKVIYFRALMPFPERTVPTELKPYWSIFSSIITKLGAGSRNSKEMDQEISMKTGGLGARSHLRESLTNLDDYNTSLFIHSHSLERNFEPMMNLWLDILNSLRYDEEEHISQLIKMMASDESASLSQSGHSYAMLRAASSLKSSSAFREMNGGLSHVIFLKKLAETNDISSLRQKLIELSKFVFTNNDMKLAINAEPSIMNDSLNHLESFVQKLPNGESSSQSKGSIFSPIDSSSKDHFVFPFNANYVAKSVLCVPMNHPDHPKLRVLTSLLVTKYIRNEIREKGGAYGGGVSINAGGIMSFYSYRDPNVQRTVDVFNSSLDWFLKNDTINKQDLKEAKLSVFQSLDKPIAPGNQGTRQFLDNVSDENFHEYRLKILDTTLEDLSAVAQTYLGTNIPQKVVSIGPDNDSLKSSDGWNKIENLDLLK